MLINYEDNSIIVAGCDEAGRGPLFGEVTAAAVILPPDYKNEILNDSKKLSEKKRDILRKQIESEALFWAVASVSAEKIDEINILNASFLAMHKALDKLSQKPDLILVDGNRFKNYGQIPHKCIVKGDGKYLCIAAASILAKTHRDESMKRYAEMFPEYFLEKHKGYPTALHKQMIKQYGLTPFHRKTFKF